VPTRPPARPPGPLGSGLEPFERSDEIAGPALRAGGVDRRTFLRALAGAGAGGAVAAVLGPAPAPAPPRRSIPRRSSPTA
jgi:hypothetical protein